MTAKNISFEQIIFSRAASLSVAAPLHREAPEVRRRVLGSEHSDTLASVNNLAAVLSEQGEYSEAARLYRETLEVRRRVLGAEHPDTLESVCGLATALGQQGEG